MAACVVVPLVALLGLAGCFSTAETTDADLDVLVTALDLLEYRPDHAFEPGAVATRKTKAFGGLWLLSYEYEPGEGLYLTSETSFGPSGSGEEHVARTVRALELGSWWNGELVMQEQESPVRWGDGSRFYLLLVDGQPIGNAFMAHDDRRALTTMFAGVYFSDGVQFDAFVRPKLRALETWDPGREAKKH